MAERQIREADRKRLTYDEHAKGDEVDVLLAIIACHDGE